MTLQPYRLTHLQTIYDNADGLSVEIYSTSGEGSDADHRYLLYFRDMDADELIGMSFYNDLDKAIAFRTKILGNITSDVYKRSETVDDYGHGLVDGLKGEIV